MSPSRRDFLKLTTIGGAAAAIFGFDLKPAFAQLRTLKIARASETRSTCPYCAVGCGTIIYTIGDRAKNVTAAVGDHERPALAQAPGAPPGSHRMAGHFLGRCHQRNRGAGEKDAR